MSSWVLKKARVSWRQEAGCDLVFKEVGEQERGKGKGKRKLGVVVPAPCFALSFFLLSAGPGTATCQRPSKCSVIGLTVYAQFQD
jgi:hypothetical protein